jgi:heme oxygenase
MSRSQQLKTASSASHERLDARIMRAQPFASLANYRRFLRLQLRFHQDIAALYGRADLAALVPELAARQRLDALQQDCADLRLMELPPEQPALDPQQPLPAALGWLYVAEGSNLGAAVLFKLAAKLGLNELHGARHLDGHADGRLRHWRGFTGALDALSFSAAEEAQLVAGARAAFERVHGLAAELL